MAVDANLLLKDMVIRYRTKEPKASYKKVYALVSARISDAMDIGLVQACVNLLDARISPIPLEFMWDDCIDYVTKKLLEGIPRKLVKVRRLGGRELSIDWSRCTLKEDEMTKPVYVDPEDSECKRYDNPQTVLTKFDDRTGTMQIFCG